MATYPDLVLNFNDEGYVPVSNSDGYNLYVDNVNTRRVAFKLTGAKAKTLRVILSSPSVPDKSITVVDSKVSGTWYWTPTFADVSDSFPSKSFVGNWAVSVSVGGVSLPTIFWGHDIYYPSDSSVNPTISSVTPSDAQGYRNTYGVYITDRSIIQAAVSCSAKYGASIVKVEHTIDSLYASTTDPSATKLIGKLLNSGSRTLKTVITDSRGKTATRNTAITVVAYQPPSVSVASAERWDTSSNSADDSSTSVRLYISGTIPSINNHILSATLTIKGGLRYGIEETTIGTYSITGPTFTKQVIVANQSIDNIYEYSWNLTTNMGDNFLYSDSVGTATPILDFDSSGMGVGIGTVAPGYGLNIGMNVEIFGSMLDPEDYSDIILRTPDRSLGVSLANLKGSTLRLIGSSSIDRARVCSHIFMENNKALGWLTTSDSPTTILRMNEQDQVELTWTSGGLKGRVAKSLFSGNWSSGSITVSETAYYNVFLIYVSGVNEVVVAMKNSSGNQINGIGGCSWDKIASAGAVSDAYTSITGFRATLSGTTWTMVGLVRHNTVQNHNFAASTVTKIVGLI